MLAFLLLFPLSALAFNPNCSDGVRVRKEFRDLGRAEWRRFKSALNHLYDATIDGTESFIDRFTRLHLENADPARGTPYTGPWYRHFTLMFENELRRYDRDVTLPYWDWVIDAARLADSPLLDDDYLGTYPYEDCRYKLRYPYPHCLIRDYSALRHPTSYDQRYVQRLISDTYIPYAKFMDVLEQAPVTVIVGQYSHALTGGSGFQDMTSPNDPLFWFQKAQLDRLWHLWQKARLASGLNPAEFNGIYKGRFVQPSDIMSPFGVRVDQVMRIDEQLCYVYQAPFSRHGIHLMALEVNSNDSIKWQAPQASVEWAKKHDYEHVEEARQFRAELIEGNILEHQVANDASRDTVNWSLFVAAALFACFLL
jgi:hypothetical protein